MAVEYCLPVIKALAEQKNVADGEYKKADEKFNSMRDNSPRETITSLVEICRQIVDSGSVESEKVFIDTTLVLLKSTIGRVWEKLDAEKAVIGQFLAGCLLNQNLSFRIRQQFGYCLEQVLTVESKGKKDDELLTPFMRELSRECLKACNDNPDAHLLSVFRFFCDACDELHPLIETNLKDFTQALMLSVSGDNEVQINVLDIKVLLFLRIVEFAGEDQLQGMDAFLPQVFKALEDGHVDMKEELMRGVMEACQRGIFSKHFQQMVETLLKLAQDDELKGLAIETIITMVEAEEKPSANVLRGCVDICFEFAMQNDDSECYLKQWLKNSDDDENDCEEDVKRGCEGLDRLCQKCTPGAGAASADAGNEDSDRTESAILPLIFSKVNEFGNSPAECLTRLNILHTITEFCFDPDKISAMIKLGMEAVQDTASAGGNLAPRIRHGAWRLLVEISDKHRSTFMDCDTSISDLLNTFTNCIEGENVVRVQLRILDAWAMITGQHEDMEVEDLQPFMERLVRGFVGNLKQVNTMETQAASLSIEDGKMVFSQAEALQARTLLSISATIAIVKTDFGVYYNDFMGQLKTLMEQRLNDASKGPDARRTLGAVIECASALGQTVDREVFKSDATTIAAAITQALKTCKSDNDEIKDYIFAAGQNLCTVLRQDFAPFVPALLSLVYAKLKHRPQEILNTGAASIQDSISNAAMGSFGDVEDEELQHELNVTVTIDPKTGEKKVMLIKTSQLEDMLNALEVLKQFIISMEQAFVPFVDDVVTAVQPLLEFDQDDDVRFAAMEIWAELVKLCKLNENSAGLQKLVFGLVEQIVGLWENAANHRYCSTATVETQAEGFARVLCNAGRILPANVVSRICAAAMKNLEESIDREPDDETTPESENGCQVALISIFGALMKHHEEEFTVQYLETYAKVTLQLLAEKDNERHQVGLYLSCDLIEYLPRASMRLWPQLVPALMNDVSTRTLPDVVQPAAFALSMFVKQPEFGSDKTQAINLADRCSKYIAKVRSSKKELSEKKQTACDNCLSCLGHLLKYHGYGGACGTNCIPEAETGNYFAGFLKCLPCKFDVEESVKVTKLLVMWLEEQNKFIVSDLSEVVRIIAVVYDTPHSDKETDALIRTVVSQVNQELLDKVCASFSEKNKKKIVRIWTDATKNAKN